MEGVEAATIGLFSLLSVLGDDGTVALEEKVKRDGLLALFELSAATVASI